MKSIVLGICLILAGLSVHSFAAGEHCGCKVKVVDVHTHEGVACHDNEVMTGHDMEKGLISCGSLECECGSCPEPKKEK